MDSKTKEQVRLGRNSIQAALSSLWRVRDKEEPHHNAVGNLLYALDELPKVDKD